VRFGFGAEQRLLADAVREVLAAHCPPKLVRAAADEPPADRGAGAGLGMRRGELWRQLAELGLFGILVPEEHGGLGLTEWDAVLVLEELGRAAAPGPILETAIIGGALLAEAPAAPREPGGSAGPGGLLPGPGGSPGLAVPPGQGGLPGFAVPPGPDALAGRWLRRVSAGGAAVSVRLRSGQYAVDADVADVLLVAAGDEVHLVDAAAARLTAQPGVDGARRLFTVDCSTGPVTRVATGDPARRLVDRACDRGALGVAAQLLGLGQYLLDASVAYAGQRRQFGRAIGSFQAVKHQLADVLLALEFARPLVYRAAYTLSRGAPSAGRDVSAAKASASDAAELAARVALQVHGAIGYTAELDLQLWLRRVWSLRGAWGGAGWHRARVAETLLGPAPAGRGPGQQFKHPLG
jgi:alkylation response protein AidB-like acyl-CoA dehydrogenase